MRRKLTGFEQMIDANIVYLIRMEGGFSFGQLRSALSRVQRRHPALRTLIRKERDGLYYEADCAPEIPIRIVLRVAEDDYRRECQAELTTPLAYDQPQLRAVWLNSESESDLLLTTTHRTCDGMSMLIIVKEVLRLLYSNEELTPYEPITPRDMIGDFQPPQLWKHKLKAGILNGLLRLIPNSRRAPENNEYVLEWQADRGLLDTLKRRCRSEKVSLHSALIVALDRALLTVLGKERSPEWIENPIDVRRGRLAVLKNDMVFFGGGGFKMRTGEASDVEFWTKARSVDEEMHEKIEQEMLDIPSRYHFQEMLSPLPSAKIQSIVRLGDALKMKGSWNRFALSNLGNVVVSNSEAPFQVKDLRLYMHSFNIRLLCLVTYTFNGEMRFYYVGDEKCLNPGQANALKLEFMELLQSCIAEAASSTSEVSCVLAAVAE